MVEVRSGLSLLSRDPDKARYRLIDPESNKAYHDTLEEVERNKTEYDKRSLGLDKRIDCTAHSNDSLCRETENLAVQRKDHEVVERDRCKSPSCRCDEHCCDRTFSSRMLLIEGTCSENEDAAYDEVGQFADTCGTRYRKMDEVLQKLDDDTVNRAERESTDEYRDL